MCRTIFSTGHGHAATTLSAGTSARCNHPVLACYVPARPMMKISPIDALPDR